jgi:hypothetical protein
MTAHLTDPRTPSRCLPIRSAPGSGVPEALLHDGSSQRLLPGRNPMERVTRSSAGDKARRNPKAGPGASWEQGQELNLRPSLYEL